MRARYQFGSIERRRRSSGDVWLFRSRVPNEHGGSTYKSRLLGTLQQLPTRRDADRAAEALRIEANPENPAAVSITVRALIERFKLDKLPDRHSTRSSYLSCFRVHITPKWGDYTLVQIAKTPYMVEKWFEGLTLSPRTKGHIKGLMYRLFECAMRGGSFRLGAIQWNSSKSKA